jgi:PIN domain nuclease of toxin-antitoxin system
MKIEPIYVIDTHALIWYLTNDRKLGKQAARIFAAAERGETWLVVSAIVVAEMYYANQKHRWFANFAGMYQQLKTAPYFRFVDFNADDVLDFGRDSGVPEMHDRIITGLARRMGAPLVAADPEISASKIVTIVW